MMRLGFSTIVVAGAVVLSATDTALAWGPATHVGLAGSLLEQLALLPAAVAAILARNGLAYVYGNIAADVVFAKRWSRIKQSCHHWSTGFGLLDAAVDDRDRAFGYGYLSHLAADTVAHSKYVPRQIVLSQCTVNFGHMFWEMRADATGTDAAWTLLERVLACDHAHHDGSLEAHIAGTLLPYDVNRRLFARMNALTLRRGFRRTVDIWSRYSRWYLPAEVLAGYRMESLERMLSILTEGSRSPLTREDPNGTSALMRLRVHRREMGRLKRRGLPVQRRLREAARGLGPESVVSESVHGWNAPHLSTAIVEDP